VSSSRIRRIVGVNAGLWRICCPSVGGIAAITKVNTHGSGGIGDFPTTFPGLFLSTISKATGLESGLASKLMLGGGRCSEQGAAGGAGGGSPISLLSMRRRDVEMRMQEGSRRLSGTRTARKYQLATGTQNGIWHGDVAARRTTYGIPGSLPRPGAVTEMPVAEASPYTAGASIWMLCAPECPLRGERVCACSKTWFRELLCGYAPAQASGSPAEVLAHFGSPEADAASAHRRRLR
jgi:hypothetical protein